MGDGDDKEPLNPLNKSAEGNWWYLLATYKYNPSANENVQQEIQNQNRELWNRYMATLFQNSPKLFEERKKRYPSENLEAFSAEERTELESNIITKADQLGQNSKDLYTAKLDSLFKLKFDFSNIDFNIAQNIRFQNFIFPLSVDFSHSKFAANANFSGASFFAAADFRRSKFFDGVDFRGTSFSGETFFDGATFSRTQGSSTDFYEAKFFDAAQFIGTRFHTLVGFAAATFYGTANFTKATFETWAIFKGTKFYDRVCFKQATFGSEISFVNTLLKDETSFQKAWFKAEPPKFFNAEIHEGTEWHNVKWPPAPTKVEDAIKFGES